MNNSKKKKSNQNDGQLTGIQVPDMNSLSLETILNMGLNEYSEQVNDIVNEAIQENRIEKTIDEIESCWDNAQLKVRKYGKNGVNKGFILESSSDIFTLLEENMITLQSVEGSRYIATFLEKVKSWQQKLNNIFECLDVWYNVQQKWIYLEGIFVGTEDIRLQLPDEARWFDTTSKEFQEIMKDVNDDPFVINACVNEARSELLLNLSKRLDRSQKSLSNYLDTKRNSFARFYFISDEELLSVIGSHDPTSIQAHIVKLFDNVHTLGFDNGNKNVIGMNSNEDEKFDFLENIFVDGAVESWMTKAEDEMKNTLRFKTKESVFRYTQEQRTEWILSPKTLGMNVLCGSQIWWTWFVEDAFRSFSVGEKHAVRKLEKKISAELSDLVILVRTPLDHLSRKKVNALLIIDVHARDIVSFFVRESILSANSFEWESQLRFYWDKKENDCLIKQCTGTFRYGYEYTGISSRLVITPLTARCYMTITQALTFKLLGGSPTGPAGTGKTETVKDLAKSLTLPCFVINCGEGMDYKVMGAIFSGLVQTGAWGCFDEFNRINIEVLSVVSAQLKSVQNALIYDLQTVNFGGSDIHFKRVKGFATCGFFITMNLGYAGRTELPDNLKALFRPVAMVVPDLEKIAENMLFSNGFFDSKILASKLVVLYSMSKKQLSKKFHYDFGLRSIKTVLIMAGVLKRELSDVPEEIILMRVLRDANLPKLVFEDVPLFLGLINDLFPNTTSPRVGLEKLKEEIELNLGENGYLCSENEVNSSQLDKAIQLFETQSVRHSTMIVGPSGSGKTHLLQTLINARKRYDGYSTKTWVVNPKAQSIDQLHGIMDPNTRDWTDGVFSKLFREMNVPLKSNKKELRWLVFDGDVDAIWVENLNSVMDDNRILTLPNGERIRLQSNCALIFEVYDLQYASPATISRCGMVWVDPKNLGFRPYYERWIKMRYNQQEIVTSSDTRAKEILLELFDIYAVPCMEVVKGGHDKAKLKQMISISDIDMCKQLCSLIESYLPKDSDFIDINCIDSIYIYCILWSIGAQLDNNSRVKFDLFLKQLSKQTLPSDLLYNNFFSKEHGKWMSWQTVVTPYIEPKPFNFHKVFVPTKISVMYNDLLERMTGKKPVLFVAENGTSKTTIIKKYIESLPIESYSPLNIYMSYYTSSYNVQENIESKIDKRMGSNYGPMSGKKLIVFIDDMNMPKVDPYETQQPIAFLLTLLDHGFFYSCCQGINQKIIKDLLYVAAMTPPGGGRNPVDPRFISRFNVFSLPKPDFEEVQHIYGKIIETRMCEFNEDVKISALKVTEATSKIFNFSILQLLPTPSKFHYIFTLRDFSRVYEGLCLCTNDKITNSNEFVRLWRNETNRVFFDRLVDEEDMMLMRKQVTKVIEEIFNDSSEYALKDPLVFGNFEHAANRISYETEDPRLYCDMGNLESVRSIFQSIIDCYNTTEDKKPLRIVMFDAALNYLLRILRILRNPRGSALLIGIGGSGKQSLSRLATYASGFALHQIVLKKGYCFDDFLEEMKEMYKKLLDIPVVFLLSDTNIVDEKILECISNMLSLGIHPGLFDSDERDAICNIVREKGISGNNDSIWDYFVETCRNNLRIVLTMSPSGNKLRVRCRNFPCLISSMTIVWFFSWPKEALEKVASHFLSTDTNVPSDSFQMVINYMVFVHEEVRKKAQSFTEITKRPNYVTSKTFLDFITAFRQQFQSEEKKFDISLKRLQGGLSKIEEAADSVDILQVELKQKKVFVDTKTKEVEMLINEIQIKTEVVKSSSETATQKQQEAIKQSKIIEEEKNNADSALMEALPAIEAAAEALNNIRREDLQELKAFNNPPIHVKLVCQMCTVLRPTGEKLEDSWADSKKMLGNNKLLDLLKDYPKGSITEKMYRTCNKILKDNVAHDITVENMATKSQAGKGLLVWVLAILRYYEVARNVEPLREKVKNMEKAQIQSEKDISQLKQLIAKLEKELSELNAGYAKANDELDKLLHNAEKMETRLTSASKLINGLTGERQRWKLEVEELCVSQTKLLGNCLLGTSFLSYLGAFTAEYRLALTGTFMNDLTSCCVSFSSHFKNESFLVTDNIVRNWNTAGLPTDGYSIQNGILTLFGFGFPLCIDPQQQAVTWIKKLYCEEKLSIKSFKDNDFLKYLEVAVQFGQPYLFVNVEEEIDPILDPILERIFSVEDGIKVVSIAGKSVEWDDNFRVFFCTKLSIPNFGPEVTSKVTVVNFCLTQQGLSDQLLNVVVSDLEKQFNDLVSNMSTNLQVLVNLEDNFLRELSSSTGAIIDNEELIATLEATKNKATEVKQKLEEATEVKKKLEDARNEYIPISRRGSILFFASSSLSALNPMYEISLDSFLDRFVKAIKDASKGESVEERIINLIHTCTDSIYDFTCMGIFERHKLTYVFQLTCMILKEKGELCNFFLNAFVSGNTDLESSVSIQKPANMTWISDSQWKDFNHLMHIQSFVNIQKEIDAYPDAFKEWCDLECPEEVALPGETCKDLSQIQWLCLIRILRPDRSFSAVKIFVTKSMGPKFVQPPVADMKVIYEQSSALTPTLFIISPGADPQADIQKLGEQLGYSSPNKFKFLSLGQGQGSIALQLIKTGYSRGFWVLLQNCHLLLSWLQNLDDELNYLDKPHSNFRLWLTTEPTNHFPLGLLRKCFKVVTEKPDGLKFNMKSTLAKIEQHTLDDCSHPSFKSLVFVLSFLHAALQERKKFGKIGWNVAYDFSESDFNISRKLISLYLDKSINENDEFIPWASLKHLIGDAMYGGRVSDGMDRRVLSTYLDEYMGDFLFDENTKFCFSREAGGFSYCLPELSAGTTTEILEYIESLPSSNSPAVLGLHPNAEISFFMSCSKNLWDGFILLSNDPQMKNEGSGATKDGYLQTVVDDILAKIPIKTSESEVFDLTAVKTKLLSANNNSYGNTSDSFFTPIQVVLIQEIEKWNELCKIMFSSLELLKQALHGQISMSESLEATSFSLMHLNLPQQWVKYAPATEKKLGSWMVHFEKRYKQYDQWIEHGREPQVMWLGGLHLPESYLTALIQTSCRKNNWPLDKASLNSRVTRYSNAEEIVDPKEGVYYISGLFLEGAGWDVEKRQLKRQEPKVLFQELPILMMIPMEESNTPSKNIYLAPVYITSSRNDKGSSLVFEANLTTNTHISFWTLQGVAIVMNTSD